MIIATSQCHEIAISAKRHCYAIHWNETLDKANISDQEDLQKQEPKGIK